MLKQKIKEVSIKMFAPDAIFTEIEDLVNLLSGTFEVEVNIKKTEYESVGNVLIQVESLVPDKHLYEYYIALKAMARLTNATLFIDEDYFDKEASEDNIIGLLMNRKK